MNKWFACLSLALFANFINASIGVSKAQADEVWSTEEYDVVYQEDRNQTAIWTYGEDGVVFIDGLAGVYSDRGDYSGYWVQGTSSRRCDTFREGADGEPTYHWGRIEISFIDSDFPSRWQAKFGLCDQAPVITLNGTPVTAADDAVDTLLNEED